jgi:spermidine synthase
MSMPIEVSERAGVRYLHFGSEWIQGAMRVRRPNALELAYTREMMAGLVMRDSPWPRNVLLVGLGAGSLTKFCYHHLPHTRVQVVEIEPRVVLAASQHFALPAPDLRLAITVEDGADYMLRQDRHFDYILIDGYDQHARVGALDSLPFYLACRARLSERGLLAVNLFGRSRGYAASVDRLGEAFEGRTLAFPSCDGGNVVAFAGAGEPVRSDLAEMRQRAAELHSSTGLDLRDTLARIEQAGSLPGGVLEL